MTAARRRRSAAALAGLAAVALLGAAAPASGASYTTWSGTVTKIADGDTVWVDVSGDGVGPVKVRNAGIQALEIGQCGADPATRRMSQLTLGKKVRLSAEDRTSTAGDRPLRFVDVATSTGTLDVQETLLREGLVLWENVKSESARSRPYQKAMEEAAAAGRGLWDGDACGAGPSSTARLRTWIQYDGEGDDKANPNVEYVRIQNLSSTDVPLGGWWLREGAGRHQVRFPSSAVIKAGGFVTAYVGKGTATSSTFYFGSDSSIFGNISSPAVSGDLGDGIYLFDPQGDIRSHVTYPCVVSCTDPEAGRVAISTVNPNAEGDDGTNPQGEYITVAALGTQPVDLTRKVLVVNSHVMELPVGTVLQPGEKLRVRSGRGVSSRLERFWQSSGPLLSNDGGAALLRNTEGTPLSCRAWGTGRC